MALSDVQKGWTKYTKFGDLDALTEADWDKVCKQISFAGCN